MPTTHHCCCVHINCEDGTLAECFNGKCFQLSIAGWSNGSDGDGDCDACTESNGTTHDKLQVWGPVPDSTGFGSPPPTCFVFGASSEEIFFPFDGGWPYGSAPPAIFAVKLYSFAICHEGVL